MVQEHATDWMLNVLLCCYKSAQQLYGKIQKYGDGILCTKFFAADRLLGIQGSSISARDVLLAQGHEELQSLPLLVFSLIQCDALRPNHGEFNPSSDARAAASANMSNMSPDVLSRCIAPRLELWSSGKDTSNATFEVVNMNMNHIRESIHSHIENTGDMNPNKDGSMSMLLIDTPSNLIIYDCKGLLYHDGQECRFDDLPAAILKAKADALKSYRVPPPVFSSNLTSTMHHAVESLRDFLIEDSVTSLSHESYEEWCSTIAEILLDETSNL
jgi:hypothetical protein